MPTNALASPKFSNDSGATAVRETLQKAHASVRPGDTLVVWKLDWLDHSLKLIFHIFAALAEFERDLIRECTQAEPIAARLPRTASRRRDRPAAAGGRLGTGAQRRPLLHSLAVHLPAGSHDTGRSLFGHTTLSPTFRKVSC